MDRSPASIIETCKRKATALDRSDSNGELFSEKVANTHRPNTNLGGLLKPTIIPRDKYNIIQAALNEQDRIITERGAEIRNRCAQLHDLKHQLGEAQADIEEYRKRIERKHRQISGLDRQLSWAKEKSDQNHKNVSARELNERKQYYENFIAEQNQIIDLGRKKFAEKAELAELYEKKNELLRATIIERDCTISAFNEQLLRVSTSSADEIAESNAARTLAMVKGLQADVAKLDAENTAYKRERIGLVTANNNYKTQIEGLIKTITAHSNALEFAKKQAAEAQAIAEDQGKLVKKLMEENARLAANQKT